MKFVAVVLALGCLVAAPTTANATKLRSRHIGEKQASACNLESTEEACFSQTDDSHQPCEWCVCEAIPSECLSPDQATQVPQGICDCSSPSASSPSFLEGITLVSHSLDEGDDEPICDSKGKSGYMNVKGSKYDENGEDKNLFYWMFEKRSVEEDEVVPFVMWLTGGPGCSSSLALLTENGPCSVNKDGKSTSLNPFSWTESAHMLWLDQPAGVGYSYGAETDYNEEMISEDAYFFLQSFFQKFPQYADSPLYIVGESYGGHYAPAIAHRIWRGNQAKADGTIDLNLSGVAVGNGLTDPQVQYQYYPEMGYNNSHGIQVFSDETYEAMTKVVPKCTMLIEQCNKGDGTLNDFICQSAFVVCNMGLTSPYQMTGLNPYDIRKKCGASPLCYDFSHVEKFLNSKSTKEALHVSKESSHWESCNMGINLKFHSDWMRTFSPFVADLLNAGIPALMYAGDVDFICNYMGNRAWTYELEWDHTAEFQEAKEKDWKGQGLARSSNGFTFLQVYDAGHMVPSDQPEVALDMITTFIQGGSFE